MTAPAVYTAIGAISAHFAADGMAKTQKNEQQNYRFRGIDQVMNALAPLLVKNRLIIIPRFVSRSRGERTTKNGGVLFFTTLRAEFDFVSLVDGSKHTAAAYGEGMDSADKSTNKAMSAAYKYAAFQTFCIPTEGDGDLDADRYTPREGGDVLPAITSGSVEGIGSGLAPGMASEGGPRHQDVAQENPMRPEIEKQLAKPDRPSYITAPAKPKAPAAPKPPAADQPKPERWQDRARLERSSNAAKKLLEGDPLLPGLVKLGLDLAQGKDLAVIERELADWVARAATLRSAMSNPEDSQAVEASYKSLRKAINEEKAIRGGADPKTGEIAA